MPDPQPPATDELAAFLEAPASYPHGPDGVELVRTHLSLVALAGRFVYKVQKPVDLGFADFSTLAKREHACREEVRLNRRLCADTYVGVVPIHRDADGALTFAETDEAPVAFAVRMRRLAEEGFLDNRIDAGDAGEDELERVARRLADCYRRQASTPEIAAWGRPEKLRVNTDENFDQTEAHAAPQPSGRGAGHSTHHGDDPQAARSDVLPRPAFDALRYYTDRFLDERAALLHRRCAEGRILEGHGDLRLEHVHLSPSAEADGEGVCIYDCVAFNERLRALDVANDAAFLAMDLDFHGAPGLSLFFARRLAALLDDPELLALIDFYKTYRAYVRAKVDLLQSQNEDLPDEKRAEQRDRARRHVQQALRYATAGSGPAVIAVMGRPATGKTTQAQALAELLGADYAASDRTRKELAGVSLRERPDDAAREALYTPGMTERTYAALCDRALDATRAKRPVVLDATFGKQHHRDRLRETLRERGGEDGIPHCFVELTASDDAIKARLADREGTRSLSDARREDFEMLAADYEAPTALEDARHVTVSTDDGDATAPDATTTAVLKRLVRHL